MSDAINNLGGCRCVLGEKQPFHCPVHGFKFNSPENSAWKEHKTDNLCTTCHVFIFTSGTHQEIPEGWPCSCGQIKHSRGTDAKIVNDDEDRPIFDIAMDTVDVLRARIAKLEAELEYERMRLAGCGTAAMANTPDTIKQRLKQEDAYYSASYEDVCRAVDREMALKADNDPTGKRTGSGKGEVETG